MNEINAFIKQKQDYISNPIFIDSMATPHRKVSVMQPDMI